MKIQHEKIENNAMLAYLMIVCMCEYKCGHVCVCVFAVLVTIIGID